MSKSTPGPWFVTHAPTSCGSVFRVGAGGKACAWIYADGIRIGVDEALPRAIELAANARLIAAAPQMLGALKAVLHYLNDRSDVDYRDGEACPNAENQMLCDIGSGIRAAIAKATGDAS